MVRGSRVEVLAEMLIENDGPGRQPVEMRRFDPVIAAATDEARMKVIETDDDGTGRDFRFEILDIGFQWDSPRLRALGPCGEFVALMHCNIAISDSRRHRSALIRQRLRPT